MTKTTVWTLNLPLALSSAAPAATDEERCQKKKLIALGKRDLCLQQERAKEVLGKTSDPAKCAEKFDKQITKADEAAAKKGASCRWLENGDGTATDLNSGLQWELKTDDASIHDTDNRYTWCDTRLVPDGGAFVNFLGTLNGGTSTGCFADKCDWRFPTFEELRGILDAAFPSCTISPCTTIPGETALEAHWSSSTYDFNPVFAWSVNFANGFVDDWLKNDLFPLHVRAVRGGS